ncbi:MAG: homoserine kinase [Cyclobacteriaceae bacterium]|nr:homoserine kinase [Cyclobacteriaceae bacterium HetDA_MAG_MS6]
MEKIKVTAPASVANVACGYDIFGFALDLPSDELVLQKRNDSKLVIHDIKGAQLPTEPDQNVATVAIAALLNHLGSEQGFNLAIEKMIKPGSGLGSSASAAAAAVVAANVLMGSPLSKEDLVQFAMAGEIVASKKPHADNVSPSILGGFTVVRSVEPLDVFKIHHPKDLEVLIIFPDVEIKTAEARKLIGNQIPLDNARTQWGNVAGLVAGMINEDWNLISNSLQDVVAEPVRKYLIPGYDQVKEIVMAHDAIGFNISGSGPCMFAFFKGSGLASSAIPGIQKVYDQLSVKTFFHTSKINTEGTIVI